MAASTFSVCTKFIAKDGVSQIFKNMRGGAAGVTNQLNKLTTTSQAVGSSLKNSFGKINSIIGATITLIATNAIKQKLDSWVDLASDLQETVGKTEQTFKNSSSAVLEWSNTSISSMGLAKQTALDTASLYGDMATGMGMAIGRASEMSMSLTQLSADLSSYKNMSQEMTKNALKGIFTGETEALKNLGVVMTQDVLEGYAKTLGMRKKFKDMTQAERIELRYSYVMSATKNSQGDFLRTGGNFANQSRMFAEQQKEIQTRLGNILLPRYNSIMVGLNKTLAKHTPAIEKGFDSMFKSFEDGLKIVSPLFAQFNDLFNYLRAHLLPEVAKYMPLIKTLLESAVVPAVSLLLSGVKGLFIVIDAGYNILKGFVSFIRDNWLPVLLALPAAIVGVQFAIDTLRLKMALLRMEGGAMALIMNTKLMSGLSAFTAGVWKSVTALMAQAAAFAMSPIGLITIGVAALVGVVILLWKNWDKITATLSNWWSVAQTALSSFWEKCKAVFAPVGNFIKSHFVDILLGALGPIGMIIQAIRKMPQILSTLGIKSDAFEVKTKNGKNGKSADIKSNKDRGAIDVDIELTNKTDKDAKVTTNLKSPHGMQLDPA